MRAAVGRDQTARRPSCRLVFAGAGAVAGQGHGTELVAWPGNPVGGLLGWLGLGLLVLVRRRWW